MTSWTKKPVLQGLAGLLFTLAAMTVTLNAASAQTKRSASSLRLAQSYITTTPLPGRTSKGIVIQGLVKKPGRTSTPPAYQPKPKAPVYRWPKPKAPTVTWPRPKTPTVTWPRPKTPTIVWPGPKRPTVTRPRPVQPWVVTPKHRHKKKIHTAKRKPARRPAPALSGQLIPQFIANEVAVLIAGTQPNSVDDALAQSLGLTKLSSLSISLLEGRLVRYAIPSGRSLPLVIAALTADPRVSLAQPNNIYLTVGQHSRTTRGPAQYSFAKLGLAPAHKISQGRGVPVAVIDTGVDVSHPNLSKSVSRSFDAVGRGKAKAQRHGTAIAGLIAGRGKVKGVAPLADLMAVRAFYMHPVYKRPVTSSAILLRALDWAFTNKARVFNMSFAGPYDPLVKAALTFANDRGIVLVAAAGNGGPKAAPAYPAAYENVIAITALDNKDRLYPQANRGSYLTAAAPGVDMLVPSLKKGYRYSSGTSLAAAQISGLIALLLEKNPDASAKDVREAIVTNARDLGPKGFDTQFGAGLADAHASLLSMTSGSVKLTSGQ